MTNFRVIVRRDCFCDDTSIVARRTPCIDYLSIYDSEGYFLYEVIRYRCSGNYYIRTITGKWIPVLMREVYPGWKITEVFNNG